MLNNCVLLDRCASSLDVFSCANESDSVYAFSETSAHCSLNALFHVCNSTKTAINFATADYPKEKTARFYA